MLTHLLGMQVALNLDTILTLRHAKVFSAYRQRASNVLEH